jgi:Raf kinase inhibitor-like YbhB/YbcL family protein
MHGVSRVWVVACAIGCSASQSQPSHADSTSTLTPAAAPAATAIVPTAPQGPNSATPIAVTSATFQADAPLPMAAVFNSFGCTGGNASPQLSWTGFPPETKSFAVTLWDADAPTGVGYVHWLVFNIPASVTSLAANAGASATPGGGVTGYSDFGVHAYGGPCPPPGDKAHRYIFTVSALDVPALTGAGPGTTYATLTFLMRGHLLAQGRIIGQFARP